MYIVLGIMFALIALLTFNLYVQFPMVTIIFCIIVLIVLLVVVLYSFFNKSKKEKNEIKKENEKYAIIQGDLDEIDIMSDENFIKYILDLLPKNGYTKVEQVIYTGDYGVDITAYKDEIKYAIQCVQFRGEVTVDVIKNLLLGKEYYDCDKAMVVTNSIFNRKAIKLATSSQIELINRDKLVILMCNTVR